VIVTCELKPPLDVSVRLRFPDRCVPRISTDGLALIAKLGPETVADGARVGVLVGVGVGVPLGVAVRVLVLVAVSNGVAAGVSVGGMV
jgi:hypothetical protein